jgi:hypothetical protein
MKLKEIEKIVNDVTEIVNCLSDDPMNTFIRQMTFKHRTLQQSFTKLCFKWIEIVASDEYKYDGRNQYSHEQCKKIIEIIKSLNNGCELSNTIPMI